MNWINEDFIKCTTKAFVYEITICKNNQTFYYIGYKLLKGKWKSYISSSKYIKNDKDFITEKRILRVFDDVDAAMKYEFDLINELDAVKSETFYNKANGGVKFNSRDLPR
jgi:hypothetical protein